MNLNLLLIVLAVEENGGKKKKKVGGIAHMEISNSISIATQNLGEVDLPILRLYFSLLNLALKNMWQRAEGFDLTILNKASISHLFLFEEGCSLIKTYEPFCVPLFVE